MMGARSSGRAAAIQMLYALECSQAEGQDVQLLVEDFWREVPGEHEGRAFADELFAGVVAKMEDVDACIRTASKHWRLERMARVDRSVLRLATYELCCSDDVPRAVVIDQAVELAKQFGAEGSSVFVNGVLERIADELKRT